MLAIVRNSLRSIIAAIGLAGCGEPAFENAGSQASLLEDREACASEIDKTPSANSYRQNPDAHPEYPMQVFGEMNRCIERRGWKQLRSAQEQEQLRDAISTEAARTAPPVSISDPKAAALMRAVEERLAQTSSLVQSGVKKD
jgi:hypothetical protein